MGKLKAVPLELKQANSFVDELHRHHDPVFRDKFRVGAMLNGKLVGVVQIGRPVSRMLDDGRTVEVTRLCSDGTENVCSSRCHQASAFIGIGGENISAFCLQWFQLNKFNQEVSR